MRIVLDTAAFINAIRSNTGAAAEVLRLAILGKVTLLMDLNLAYEYRDVGLRSQHIEVSRKTVEELEFIITTLESIAIPVLVKFKHRPLSKDANDNMILDLAISGDADAIVTNNLRDFLPAAEDFGIMVLTPGEFLIELRRRETNDASE